MTWEWVIRTLLENLLELLASLSLIILLWVTRSLEKSVAKIKEHLGVPVDIILNQVKSGEVSASRTVLADEAKVEFVTPKTDSPIK